MKQNVYFVSGIDTDAGKSYATGFLAREWNKNGQRTITQNFIQTGNVDRPIDFGKIKRATEELSERYDYVLLEGAGGLMVPLTTELLTIDYIAQENYPLIFVTSGKLGSINHTLLSLEAIQKRDIVLDTVLYNMYPTPKDKTIQNDTMNFIQNWLKKYFPDTKFILVPEIKE